MSRQSLVRKEEVFKEHVGHHSESVAVLSIIHSFQRLFPITGAPACIPSPLPACFLILQVPQPLPAPSPPSLSAHLDLNALSHYKPNITSHLLISHQHLLYQVIFLSIVPAPSKAHNHPAIFWLTLAPGALPNITQHHV